MVKYIVVQSSRVIGFYNSFNDAVEAVIEIGSGEIYRVELVAKLSEEEIHNLREIILSTSIEPVEAPVVSRKTSVSKNAVVIDRFLNIEDTNKLAAKLRDVDIYLLTTSITGSEKIGSINYIGVESSIDVCSFVEELAEQNYRIIIFTSDKKLYTHLSKKRNIRVFYKLIDEYSNTDELIESIIRDIEKMLSG